MNILLVEDVEETAESLRASLQKAGFAVDVAFDGAIGYAKAVANGYDIVILDIGLPGKDGRQICRELRAAGKEMPILVLSAIGEVGTKVELLEMGADDYLAKPFFFAELNARVQALLRRPRHLEGEVLFLGNLSIMIKNRTVKRSGRDIPLTLKEFSLLEYLVRNSGRVVPRGELLDHVWDTDKDPFTNTIETHISSLRRKLDGGRKKSIIRTASGIGYTVD